MMGLLAAQYLDKQVLGAFGVALVGQANLARGGLGLGEPGQHSQSGERRKHGPLGQCTQLLAIDMFMMATCSRPQFQFARNRCSLGHFTVNVTIGNCPWRQRSCGIPMFDRQMVRAPAPCERFAFGQNLWPALHRFHLYNKCRQLSIQKLTPAAPPSASIMRHRPLDRHAPTPS